LGRGRSKWAKVDVAEDEELTEALAPGSEEPEGATSALVGGGMIERIAVLLGVESCWERD
jgi:hypothetical protein